MVSPCRNKPGYDVQDLPRPPSVTQLNEVPSIQEQELTQLWETFSTLGAWCPAGPVVIWSAKVICQRELNKSGKMVRCLREKFVDRTLKSFFYWLGCKIGESPGYFLVVPLLLTALCISGFQQMDYEFEPEYLGWTRFPIWSDHFVIFRSPRRVIKISPSPLKKSSLNSWLAKLESLMSHDLRCIM